MSSEGSTNHSRVKYFSLFNKLAEIAQNLIQTIEPNTNPSQDLIKVTTDKLAQCIGLENDLLQNCEDLNGLEIVPVFTQVLDYLTECDHVITLYSTAILHFKRIKVNPNQLELYNSLFFGAMPFVRLFGNYEFNVERMFNEFQSDKEKFGETLKESFLKIASESGRKIFQALKTKPEDRIVPKQVILQCGLNADGKVSQEYYIHVSEALIGHYILHNKFEELILLSSKLHSFYGILTS